ncbi:hypothetical protein J421_2395 [Gemmatirosa kalamazoonensis]|uniref:PKD domain containing protein n=1 Tax=Gemmatirosa kalamazoonensis TaxID=861299 RepID=W0RHM7_9BACT|nr:hypothetical protein [Gemmatirosa kalamazoonensis]AHG89932.1 hypothetical protein J421_2395 [Gemmatirosa kalamazoonensis]
MPPLRRPRLPATLPATLLGALLLAACAGAPDAPAAPPPAPPSQLALTVTPADETLAQRGLALVVTRRDGRPIKGLHVFADSGTATQIDFRWSHDGWFSGGRDSVSLSVYAPTPGRHTFTIVTQDPGGVVASAAITRTFVIPDVDYAVTVLPDLGAGGGANGISTRGDVAGWVTGPNGRRRAAVWRAGALTVLPVDTAVNVTATHVNTAGDVLLGFGGIYGSFDWPTAVWVRSADGAMTPVGASGTAGFRSYCCSLAADLTDTRQALGASPAPDYAFRSATLDLRTGRQDTSDTRYVKLNDNGQAVGTTANSFDLYITVRLVAKGFVPGPLPSGPLLSVCDLPGRYTRTLPIDLDDDANVLVDYCGNPALLVPDGQSVWLDRYVGRGQVRLSRQGGIVAALDSAGALHTWRFPGGPVSRLRLSDTRWRVDSLGAVNASGAVAARGIDASGKHAALLLTPVASR